MEWSNDLILEFLDLYEREPVIWNPKHQLHKNRHEVHDAWKRIQEKLSFDVHVIELKKKKDSLMASFRTCLSKIKHTQRSGSGADVYKPRWFAFERMASFLRARDQPRVTIKIENFASALDAEESDSGCPDVGENPEENTSRNIVNENPAPPSTNDEANNFKHPLQKKRRVEEAYGQKNDDCELYGQLVARKLRVLDDKTRDIAMNRIDNLLFEMKMNLYQQHQQSLNVSPSSAHSYPSEILLPSPISSPSCSQRSSSPYSPTTSPLSQASNFFSSQTSNCRDIEDREDTKLCILSTYLPHTE